MPFTDHVAVSLRLRGDLHRTLGYRLVSPAGIPEDRLRPLLCEDTKAPLHSLFGPPPSEWQSWTSQAELELLRHTGTDPKGNRGRGQRPRTAPQRVGRAQVGTTGSAGPRALIRLRLRVLRFDRLRLLEGHGPSAEAHKLRLLLGDTTAPTEQERALLDKWHHAADIRRRREWKTWVDTQLQRSGGRLYQWAQRLGAIDDLTTLSPGPDGATQTLTSRLADARSSWHQLWRDGDAWTPSFENPLPPITGGQIREVVSRLRKGKAHGADGWRPQELAALPDAWLEALAACYNRWEAQGPTHALH